MTAELWEPRSFSVGQRVRVRLSGECRFCAEVMRLQHGWHFDGMTGTVVPTKPTYAASNRENGHVIAVVPDSEWIEGTGIRDVALFAGVELEPLADAPASDGSRAAGEER